MAVLNRFSDLLDEITGWRHDFHRHPELQFNTNRPSRIVAEKLAGFGCDEMHTAILVGCSCWGALSETRMALT